MTELVDRYVHQVGRYLPPKERAEIEAELRSQIQDQLDDRFMGTPTQEEVASVLAEFGHPYRLAASYNREQYLVGPDLYPYMMMVLRYVWGVVPTIVIFLDIFGAFISQRQGMWLEFIGETLLSTIEATFGFSAVVILIFAFIQRIRAELDEVETPFDPVNLPKVDDPRSVDRFEAVTGIVIGTLMTLALLYFLYVGGLTLRFNLSDPGDVIPVPVAWLVLLIITIVAEVVMHLLMLRRNRWSTALWFIETVLEVIGAICLYFAVLSPLFTRITSDNPALMDLLGNAAEIIAIGFALLTLVSRGSKLVSLWNYHNSDTPPLGVKSDV